MKTKVIRFMYGLKVYPIRTSLIRIKVICIGTRSNVDTPIKLGSCAFQCEVPHQWIAQRKVKSVYCDGVGCHVL